MKAWISLVLLLIAPAMMGINFKKSLVNECDVAIWGIPRTPLVTHVYTSAGINVGTTSASWTAIEASDCWEWGVTDKLAWKYTCPGTADFVVNYRVGMVMPGVGEIYQHFFVHSDTVPFVAGDKVGHEWEQQLPFTGHAATTLNVEVEAIIEDVAQNDYIGIWGFENWNTSRSAAGAQITIREASGCVGF